MDLIILNPENILLCIKPISIINTTRIMLTPSEMKDKMEDLAGKNDYIDSIFNYCDRWCERCTFTSQCRNYAFGKDAPSPDGSELWDYIHNVFQATMLMLNEMMEKMGIDPDEIDKMEAPVEPEPEKHPLYLKAYKAASEMQKWLEKNNPGEPPSYENGINLFERGKDSRFLDAIEVIYWYNFFVPAKIARALYGLYPDEVQEIQSDSNGSAKIALIAIDRLIASWSVLMENMLSSEDEILKILINLTEIRKQTEITFPSANKFVRPGFDE
jgi:hypothetical protein